MWVTCSPPSWSDGSLYDLWSPNQPPPSLGPKWSLLATCLPLFVLNWVGLVVARAFPSFHLVVVSRALAGVAVGTAISIVPSYIIDIASPQYQGLLALLPQFFVSISCVFGSWTLHLSQIIGGLLSAYIVGALVDWWWLSLACLLLQVRTEWSPSPAPAQPLLGLLLLLAPDSPASLVARGHTEAARYSSIVWTMLTSSS